HEKVVAKEELLAVDVGGLEFRIFQVKRTIQGHAGRIRLPRAAVDIRENLRSQMECMAHRVGSPFRMKPWPAVEVLVPGGMRSQGGRQGAKLCPAHVGFVVAGSLVP